MNELYMLWCARHGIVWKHLETFWKIFGNFIIDPFPSQKSTSLENRIAIIKSHAGRWITSSIGGIAPNVRFTIGVAAIVVIAQTFPAPSFRGSRVRHGRLQGPFLARVSVPGNGLTSTIALVPQAMEALITTAWSSIVPSTRSALETFAPLKIFLAIPPFSGF